MTPSSGVSKKFLFGLKKTWDPKLSPGLMLLPFMTAHLFQLQFAGNEQCWHSSRLITLKLFRTDHNNAPLVLVCVGWFHVDTNSGIPKKFFVGEIVFWFDVAHVHDHSLLPVERYWQPSWLITFRFFRTREAPRSFEEDLGTEVVFWFDAGRTATACKNDVYLFPIQLDEKVAVLHLPASSRQG